MTLSVVNLTHTFAPTREENAVTTEAMFHSQPLQRHMAELEEKKDENEDFEEDDEEENDEETDDSDVVDKKGKKPPVDAVKAANDEAKRRRIQARTERLRAAALETELNELKNKDKSESDKAIQERDELRKKIDALEPAHLELQKRHAVIVDALAMGFDQKQMKPLLKLMDMDAVEIEDDGTVTGVQEALEAAKKEYPQMFKANGSNGSDADDDDEKEEKVGTGSRHNSGKKGKLGQMSEQELRAKYPALGF